MNLTLWSKRDLVWVARYLVIAALLTLILIGLVAWRPSLAVPVLGIPVAGLIFVFAQRVPYPSVVALAAFVTASLYRGMIYATQVSVAGIVITPLDLMWMYVVLRFYTQPIRASRVTIAGYMVLGIALLTAVMGVISGQPLYNIAKLLRTEVFLGFGVIIGTSLLLSERILVLRGLVLGGLVTALMQFLTFIVALGGINIWSYLGISASGSTVYQILDRTATASYRDNGVVINFSLLALLIVLSFLGTRPGLFRPSQNALLIAVLVGAIVLSLTRSNWIVLVVAVALWSLVSGVLAKQAFWWITCVLGSIVIVVVSLFQILGIFSVLDLLLVRFTELGTGGDGNTLGDRALETNSAIYLWSESPILGVGAADVAFTHIAPDGVVHDVVRNQVHNGFVQYLLGGGIVSLTVIGFLFMLAVVNPWIRSLRTQDERPRGLERAVFLMTISIAALSITTGLINDFQQAVIAGIVLGMSIYRTPHQTGVGDIEVET